MDALFQSILRAAVDAGASDIHIKPGAPVHFRVNRALMPVDAPLHSEEWVDGVVRDLVPAHLAPVLKAEQELDFAFTAPGTGRFRTNVFKHQGRWALALRFVKTQIPPADTLHLPPTVHQLAEAPRGIVIIAGAIGSGKSTTLASMLDHLNRTRRKHIVTLEDPIEYLFKDQLSIIEQREIGLDTATFSSGLKNALRQDPDVLVIGEMRDAQSAAAAMSAANIGHLVITTLHTSDATRSVQRILEFFPNAERDYARRLFADTLHGVVCQRLVRTAKAGIRPALEILINNRGVSNCIATERFDQILSEIELGNAEGMQSFDQHLRSLVGQGVISRDEAIAHAANPDALRMAFQGVQLNDSSRIMEGRH